MQDLVLSGGAVLRAGASVPERLDLRIDQVTGTIAAIGRSLPADGARNLPLDGWLVVPGLVDAHQHLDKSRTRAVVQNASGTLAGASAGYRAFATSVTREDITARSERTLAACSERGTVAIRTHTNIEPQSALRGIEAMLDVRERWAGKMTVQVVAHVTSEATSMHAAAEDWLRSAIDYGVDALGGVPAYSDQPIAFLNMLFRLAEQSGLPLDLHVDEHLDATNVLFDALIERTLAHGMEGRVVAGHCSALSALDPDAAARVAAGFARAGIAVVTLPSANLFLLGRNAAVLPPRGTTRINELVSAGVLVAAASDNIQDPFVPTGSGDLLETARLVLVAGHLGLDDLRRAFDMVSRVPAAILGLAGPWGIEEGARADLLITRAADVDDLVASGPLERMVMVRGRIISPNGIRFPPLSSLEWKHLPLTT